MVSIPRPLSRRAVLRGAGALVALPFLDAMQSGVARAASTASKRFVVAYGGISHGSARVSQPATTGPLGVLPRAFRSLEPVKQHVTILSKLTVPVYLDGQTPPPGSRKNAQHGMIAAPVLTGVHSRDGMAVMPIAHSGDEAGVPGAHTVDQLVADAIGGSTLIKSLQARVQTIGYGGGGSKGIVSGRMEGTQPRPLAPTTSLTSLYTNLFGDSTVLAPNLRRRKSVLDLVLDDAKRLSARLGSGDRARLETYFTEIRDLERRIDASVGGSCVAGPMPAEPPVGVNAFGGWSSETARGDAMADMIALALSCDLTRSVSWMLTFDQCFMTSQYSAGVTEDMHACSHSGTDENLADNANWHAERFGRLVQRLAALDEGTGTVLDQTFAVLVFAEGENAHNSASLTYVAAGSKDVLKMGQHINAQGAHPATLMVSGMQALGMNVSRLGEISGELGALML